MHIGNNIARLRRELGLTQEQLGNLVRVSAQAVSKWEKGGMPDAELLPAIADALHVTIDTLFGRDNAKSADIKELFTSWYLQRSSERRAYDLFELLITAQQNPVMIQESNMDEFINLPLKTCRAALKTNGESIPIWLRSQFMDDYGIILSVPAEDCPLYLILPEPKAGYLSNFLEPKRYQELFAALALDGSMELLFFLYSKKTQYYSLPALASACKKSEEAISKVLDALNDIKLIVKREIVETDGEKSIYALNDDPSFIPFLLFSRWLVEYPSYIMALSSRKKPILNQE